MHPVNSIWVSDIGLYVFHHYIIRKEQWDRRNNCVKRDRNGNILYYNKEAGLADYIEKAMSVLEEQGYRVV